MILVVDTYNVLHVVGVLPPELAGIDLAGLVQLLQRSRYASDRVELVCDGMPPDATTQLRPPGPIRVRFAGLSSVNHNADDLIAALITRSSAPKRLLVVSSDNWVIRQARRRRCRTLSSEQFLSQLAADHASAVSTKAPPPPPNAVDRSDLAQWLKYFNIKPSELDRPASTPMQQPPVDAPPPSAPSEAQPSSSQRAHHPLTADIIEEAERIWAEHSSREI